MGLPKKPTGFFGVCTQVSEPCLVMAIGQWPPLDKKQQILCNSRPCWLASQPSGWLGLCASLTQLSSPSSKCSKNMSSNTTNPSPWEKLSLSLCSSHFVYRKSIVYQNKWPICEHSSFPITFWLLHHIIVIFAVSTSEKNWCWECWW